MSGSEPRPEWLEQALSARSVAGTPGAPTANADDTVPSVGQLRVLQHMDLRRSIDRLGVIVDVDERLAVAYVIMLSPFIEYQTSVDYALNQASTGAPMPLIAESDLRGAVWFAQLGQCLGVIDTDLAASLDAAGGGAPLAQTGLRQSAFGLPVRDERDPRWSWKLAELDALSELTAECDSWVLDGTECPGVVDPALMWELARLAAPSPEATEALFSMTEAHAAWMTEDSLEALSELLERADPDTQAALLPLLESGLTHLAGVGATSRREVTWEGRRKRGQAGSLPLAEAVASRAADADRCVVVITSRRSWGGTKTSGLAPATVSVAGAGRVQVRPIDVYSHQSEVAA